jgi:cellobiose phosphorylase
MNHEDLTINKAIAISILGVTTASLIHKSVKAYYSITTLRTLKRTSRKWEKAVDGVNKQIEQNRVDSEFLDIINRNKM